MKRVWISIGICFSIFLISFIVWAMLPGKGVLSEKEKEAAFKNLLGRTVHTSSENVPITRNLHKNNYVQFLYPSSAKIYVDDNKSALRKSGVLDSFAFALLDDHTSVVVQVVRFDSSLKEYPAVNLRLLQKDDYHLLNESTVSGELVFSKSGDLEEETKFFQKNGEVISIAVTGYSQEKVDTLFSEIINSLKIF